MRSRLSLSSSICFRRWTQEESRVVFWLPLGLANLYQHRKRLVAKWRSVSRDRKLASQR